MSLCMSARSREGSPPSGFEGLPWRSEDWLDSWKWSTFNFHHFFEKNNNKSFFTCLAIPPLPDRSEPDPPPPPPLPADLLEARLDLRLWFERSDSVRFPPEPEPLGFAGKKLNYIKLLNK